MTTSAQRRLLARASQRKAVEIAGRRQEPRISAGPSTEGVARKAAQVDQRISLGEIRSAPRTMSGWHHHGEHTTCV